jgi:hypothetical protein
MRGIGERVRVWRQDGFTLELWDTHRPTGTGRLAHTLLAYRLSDRSRVIFQGDSFTPPLGVCIDSDECVAACLFWFTLKPGDTDEEFFEGYTPQQRKWIESGRVDDLSSIAWEMERP